MRIRLARPDEAELIRKIEDSAAARFKGSAHAYVTEHPAPPAKVYAAMAAEGLVLMADADGDPVGFAACELHPDALHLKELAVLRHKQSQGVGRALIKAVAKEARRRGRTAVTLTTFQDLAWNAPWYARQGFVELGAGTLGERLREELADEDARGLASRCAMRLSLTP
ncbi:GNAT family N-acetyltransferase [Phenylobacterium sp.]|uniref:GNAT family N-acetyltransferase n=1 Tax=Phenylobacterium sp. TaxID=1871053 RepID=UPI002DE9CD18|nr:GNAT family N-acetyltransferase [Phenylobacterium sp.]